MKSSLDDAIYEGRKLCDQEELQGGYMGSAPRVIHDCQMADPDSWVHSSKDRWLEKAKQSGIQLELPFEGQPLQEGPKYNDPLKENREGLTQEVLEQAKEKAKQSYEDLLSLGYSNREASANLLNAYVNFLVEFIRDES